MYMDRTESKLEATVDGLKQRAFTRLPFEHPVRWSSEPDESGAATTQNIGRGGMSIALARYLRPGRELRIFFHDIAYEGSPVSLEVRIAWCRTAVEDSKAYLAGLEVLHAQPETLGRVSEVFYKAVDRLRDSEILHVPATPCPCDRPSLAS